MVVLNNTHGISSISGLDFACERMFGSGNKTQLDRKINPGLQVNWKIRLKKKNHSQTKTESLAGRLADWLTDEKRNERHPNRDQRKLKKKSKKEARKARKTRNGPKRGGFDCKRWFRVKMADQMAMEDDMAIDPSGEKRRIERTDRRDKFKWCCRLKLELNRSRGLCDKVTWTSAGERKMDDLSKQRYLLNRVLGFRQTNENKWKNAGKGKKEKHKKRIIRREWISDPKNHNRPTENHMKPRSWRKRRG